MLLSSGLICIEFKFCVESSCRQPACRRLYIFSEPPLARSNEIGAESLNTELSLGFTVLICARMSSIDENITQYLKTARAICQSVSHLLETANLGPRERDEIVSRLGELKVQREAADEWFQAK